MLSPAPRLRPAPPRRLPATEPCNHSTSCALEPGRCRRATLPSIACVPGPPAPHPPSSSAFCCAVLALARSCSSSAARAASSALSRSCSTCSAASSSPAPPAAAPCGGVRGLGQVREQGQGNATGAGKSCSAAMPCLPAAHPGRPGVQRPTLFPRNDLLPSAWPPCPAAPTSWPSAALAWASSSLRRRSFWICSCSHSFRGRPSGLKWRRMASVRLRCALRAVSNSACAGPGRAGRHQARIGA